MTDTEITRIRIDNFEVGIVGLKEALESAMSACVGKPDSLIADELLEMLARKNYIPATARSKYSESFLNEFRRWRGDKLEEQSTEIMDIKVLGPGCYQCDSLHRMVMKVLTDAGRPASVEHITDIKQVASIGLFSTPALMINGKVVSMGSNLSERKIRDLIDLAAK